MNYDADTVELIRATLILTLKISLPVLAAGVVFGLVISLVQSVTSIQDQTLATVPKIVVMIAATVLILPWIVQRLIDFTVQVFSFSPV